MTDKDLQEIRGMSVQSTRETNNILFTELLQFEKLKSTWIGQLITISATIIGGFALLNDKDDWFTLSGLFILFLTIVLGLIKIISNINNQVNRLTESFEKQNDYSIRVNILTYLEQESTVLNDEERELKNKLNKEIEEFHHEIGIVDNKGELSKLSGSLNRDKITIGNYILIFGFAIGGLLIGFADKLVEIICN